LPSHRFLALSRFLDFAALQSLPKLNLRLPQPQPRLPVCLMRSSNPHVQIPQRITKEKAMVKQTTALRRAAIAVISAASLSLPTSLSLPIMSIAQARQGAATRSYGVPLKSHPRHFAREPAQQCKIVDTITHRCLTFHSDSTWPGGLPDYHGENGG
jgi:hypothetical protein